MIPTARGRHWRVKSGHGLTRTRAGKIRFRQQAENWLKGQSPDRATRGVLRSRLDRQIYLHFGDLPVEYLAHSDPGFTLRTYTRLVPSSYERARLALDSVFTAGKWQGPARAQTSPSDLGSLSLDRGSSR